VLEFGFNLNQGCSGVGTHGNGVPTLLFLALHPWVLHNSSRAGQIT